MAHQWHLLTITWSSTRPILDRTHCSVKILASRRHHHTADKVVAKTTADRLTLCHSLSSLPMSPCLSRTHKDKLAHRLALAPHRQQTTTTIAAHPVRSPNGVRQPRCLLSPHHQQQPIHLTCPGCHTHSRMAHPTRLELQGDFLASEDRDFMLCHRWLPCVMDKHLAAGNKSTSKKRRRKGRTLLILAMSKRWFSRMVFGRDKKRICGKGVSSLWSITRSLLFIL
jgi:hypothetical protein